jgi:hypothetical protein
MKKLTLAILIALSGAAFAQSSSLKPGLWEIKPISQIVDGRDMTAQMASAQAKMQQEMANMPPDQRKQVEAMMGHQGASAGGGIRICVSPAMAARDKPMVDPEGRCEPATVNRSGNKTSFEFNCTANGRTSVGKGESTVSGDTVTTRVDLTMTDARGRHTIKSESQMKYLGSDCQGIKPLDQLAKKAQDAAH